MITSPKSAFAQRSVQSKVLWALTLSFLIPLFTLLYLIYAQTVLKPSLDLVSITAFWALVVATVLLMTIGGQLIWSVVNGLVRSVDLTVQQLAQRADDLKLLRDRLDLDTLTGLAHRTAFRSLLNQALARAERDPSHRLVALLLVDIDRFRVINETLGRDAGDFILQAVAERMRNCVRQMDTVAIARFEGANFAVILEGIPRTSDPEKEVPWPETAVAKRMLDSLASPLVVGDREVFASVSIGISLYPRDGADGNALLKSSEIALRRVKDQGGGTYRFFRSAMDTQVDQSLALEAGLRRALEREEFRLHYQPQVNLQSGQIIGAEALLRWSHPEHGPVSPAEFIPVAERSGLIAAIGEWVLREACTRIQAWQAQGLPSLHVAVNVSPSQFRQEALAQKVGRVLKSMDLDPEYLELELTEGVLIEDKRLGRNTLRQLKDMGLRLCIDDFGTGYSSFSYLQQFPLDVLKIDRSFVSDLITDPAATAIVTAIISLGHALRLTVVAEGVETEEQLAFLRAQGCDAVQGYLCGRPVPAEEFGALIRERV